MSHDQASNRRRAVEGMTRHGPEEHSGAQPGRFWSVLECGLLPLVGAELDDVTKHDLKMTRHGNFKCNSMFHSI